VVAATLLLMLTFATNSSTLHVIVVTSLLGLGMAHVMPAATESIMGSLPRDKAGVGSAMNDTTRQVGGAIGVALLGSILSSRYGAHVTSALAGIAPDSVIAGAKDSVGTALGVAQNDPAAQGIKAQIIAVSRDGFVSGMHTALLLAAVIVLLGAAAVYRWLPARIADGDIDAKAPHADASDLAPLGMSAVDITPLAFASNIADELDLDPSEVTGEPQHH
jgi:hypothetical protein